MNWMEFLRIAVLSIVSLVIGAYTLSFAWVTCMDKARARRQAVPESMPEFPWLPEKMTAYAQAQAVKRERQQEAQAREVAEHRAELEQRAAR
jgi:hypothetical protein